MKTKILIPVLCFLCLVGSLVFSSCSGNYTFNYDDTEIESITIITVSGGGNKEDIVAAEKYKDLVEDLNGLNYTSYSGNIAGISSYQIVIKFKTEDEEIIDAFRIRRTDNKPLKYQCDEVKFKGVAEKYIK